MWCELIQNVNSTARDAIELKFADGVNEEQIRAAEGKLGVVLPIDLKALLCETNGVCDQYGYGINIIWPLEDIILYNREMSTLPHYVEIYKPFTDLLFFTDAGNGDRFAFPVIQGVAQPGPVFAWDHEDDRRWEVASSLRSYLEEWLSGRMSI